MGRLLTIGAALAALALAFALSPVPGVPKQHAHDVSKAKVQDLEALTKQLAGLIQFKTVGDARAPGHVSGDAEGEFLGALQVT